MPPLRPKRARKLCDGLVLWTAVSKTFENHLREFLKQFFRAPLFIVVVPLLVGCLDAPRDNSLDPSSPYFQNSASISGQVSIRDQNSGIPSASVQCVEQGIFVTSDSNGNYAFGHLSSGSLTLVASKTGFVEDTQRVQLNAGASLKISFALNADPVATSENIITHKYDQYYPSPVYTVDVSASVTDPNGIADVDSVWFEVDSLLYPMVYSINTKLFETILYKYDFPTNTIDWLVGKSLTIRCKDRYGAIGAGEPFFVTRVIENEATPTYPTSLNNDTTGSTPLFKWLPPEVTFNYTYTLECLRVDAGTETLVWTLSDLSSTILQQQFPDDGSGLTLTSGNYVWSVAVVDNFGNSARSKETAFVVR